VRPDSLDIRRDELRNLFRRSRETVLIAAITGVATGLVVRGLAYLGYEIYHRVLELPLWGVAIAPAVGLVLSAIVLRMVGGAGVSSATADEYLRAFHDPAHRLRPRAAIARICASIVTVGSGGALGLEGPSMYGGATLGASIQRRIPERFRSQDHRVLMVAGAAAGVSAIFKAPATGAIFALEVPYHGDMARRMLLPALVASACGYLTFVSLSNTVPVLSVGVFSDYNFQLIDLFGALLVGSTCAVGARMFAKTIRFAKTQSTRPWALRIGVCSALLVALFFAVYALTDQPLTVGSGLDVFRDWLFFEADIAIWLLLVVFVARCLASAIAVAGGGVGGVFIPLVVGGGLIGRAVGELVHPARVGLYTLLGVAALLGAGYRVPLAAVMFVAESTGRPNFVVPALFAAVAAELVMGDQSITAYQRGSDSD
jgi:CIC family chloride channel protein